MNLDSLLATLHLLALAIGLPAIWARARALRRPLDADGLRSVFLADNAWGIAAGVWVATGLVRLFGPFAKGSAYYFANHLFWTKMGLFLVILALELAPMITLVRWRLAMRRGDAVDPRRAGVFARISDVQLLLVLGMVIAATGMARGLGTMTARLPH